MKRSLQRVATVLAGVVTVATLAACGNASDNDSATSSGTDGSAYPRTVKTSTTETTLDAEPARIAALGTVSLENLIALDTEPVYASVDGTKESQPYVAEYWDKDYVDSSGDKDSKFERIAASDPDLIIAPSWTSYQDSDTIHKLENIAPTIVYDISGSTDHSWTEGLSQVAKALDKSEQATALIDTYESTVAKQKEFIAGLDGSTFVTGSMTDGGKFQLTTMMSSTLREVGLTPGSPQKEIEEQKADGKKPETSISEELLGTIDADYIFDFATKKPEAINLRKDSRAYREHVLDHAYWMYDNEGSYLGTAFNNSGALGKPWMMERINEMFDQHIQL